MSLFRLDKLSLLCYPMNGYPENHVYSIFTGLSVKQFDGIYKEIESKYTKYEVKRLSSNRIYRIRERKRDVGAGRHFKLDVKNRFVMVLVYYRLYITYTLTGFLFGLDQSNVCRDIHNIEALIRQLFTHSSKDLQHNQKAQHHQGGS